MKNTSENLSSEIQLIIESCKEKKDLSIIEKNIKLIKNWDDFISLAYSHGVFPLVYNTLKIYDDLIPNEKLSYMKKIYMDIVKDNMLMTSELIKVMKLLEENHIEVIPFKGPTLSQLAYGDIISRQYVDIDVIVNDFDKHKVIKILNSINYNLEDNLSFSRSLDSISVITFFNKETGVVIEIHWKLLSINYAINIDKINFFNEIQLIKLNNYEIKTFNSDFLLIYLCIHGSKHFYERYSWINDIHLLISKENINWGKVFNYIKALEIERIIYSSIFLSFLIFNTKIPENIKNDKKAQSIAINIIQLKDKSEKLNYKSFSLLLSQRTGFFKKMEFIIKLFFYPKETDLVIFNLPKSLNWLYIVIRPIRLVIKTFTKKET